MVEYRLSADGGQAAGSTLFRVMLLVDAVASGVPGLFAIVAAGWLSPHLGLPEGLLRGAGLVLLPWTAYLLYVVSRPVPTIGLVRGVIGFNLIWVAASLLLLVSSLVAPTSLGTVVVILQAAGVLVFATLQAIGWQRSQVGGGRLAGA